MKKVALLPVKNQDVESASLSLQSRSDDALMRLAQAGVDRAFEHLVTRHQRMVLGTAVKYLGDPILAEDIAQNSFLDLYRNIAMYRQEGRFRAFLAKIVINNCRMTTRRARSEERTRQEYRSLPTEKTTDENILLKREQQRLLDRALGTLSPKLREVVILRYAAGLSYSEIADTLSIRVGTVKSRVFYGVEKLSEAMEALEQ